MNENNCQNLEIIIKNKDEIDSICNTIKTAFDNEEKSPISVIVRFDENIDTEDLKVCLEVLWKNENESNHSIDILIKNLSYEKRREALRIALKTENLSNKIFLMNVFCLVKGYNTFDEAYFESEQVFLNDEVEFLDIFDDLEAEISSVTMKLAEYYVSMLKTCNLVEAVNNNPNAVEMEKLYVFLFSMLDVTIMAKILSSVKDPSIWETKKIVLYSLNYLGQMAEKFMFTNTILNLLSASLNTETKKDAQ